MQLIMNILVVFALTLVLTKSKILAGKREFVEQRYEASKIGGQTPGWIHRIWHACWTCPMCSGFWMTIPVCFFYPAYGFFTDVLVVFGANWLVHCLEELLFFAGKFAESISEIDFEQYFKAKKDFYNRLGNTNLIRLVERKIRNFLDETKN